VNGSPGQPGERSLPPEAAAALEEGLRRFRTGDREGAHEMFGQAHRRAPSDLRIQSWYGLTLVLVERNSNLGVVLVDAAVRSGPAEPELIVNQSRVAMALGQRVRAVRALERGLALHPGDPELTAARAALGTRQRPVIGFLSRRNVLNRWLGRLQHRWTVRHPRSGGTPRRDGEG
jgi:Flp pilus assembly protein TadD